MSDSNEQNIFSPAVNFLAAQQRHRASVRDAFKKEARDFITAHELVLSGIISCLDRFGGRKWSADLETELRVENRHLG